MNIFEKLLAITSELPKVAKNLEVGFGQSKYKAVGEADVLAAVRPLEEKYKVYSYPANRKIIETGEIETKNGAKNLFIRVETTYRFVNIEKPDEFIEIISYGDGVDPSDKSVGKSMTYSDKYALLKAYKIMTGDDPDQDLSPELKGKTSAHHSTNKANIANEMVVKQVVKQEEQHVQGEQPQPNKPCNSFQLEILNKQDEKIKAFALKKYSIATLEMLTQEQAQYIIDSMMQKGTLKV